MTLKLTNKLFACQVKLKLTNLRPVFIEKMKGKQTRYLIHLKDKELKIVIPKRTLISWILNALLGPFQLGKS